MVTLWLGAIRLQINFANEKEVCGREVLGEQVWLLPGFVVDGCEVFLLAHFGFVADTADAAGFDLASGFEARSLPYSLHRDDGGR